MGVTLPKRSNDLPSFLPSLPLFLLRSLSVDRHTLLLGIIAYGPFDFLIFRLFHLLVDILSKYNVAMIPQ